MRKHKQIRCLTVLTLTLTLGACSSLSERKIASMDGNSRPNWASQEKALTVKDGKLLILGYQELPVDAKVSAAYRLSDNAARSELSKMIQNQFSSILQNLEEGVSDDGNLTRFYSSEVSKNMIRDLRITTRYWEKVQTIDSDGEPIFRLRVFSLAEIPEVKLKKMIRDSLEKNQIDPEVKKQVLGHFESEIKQFQGQ
jgi:hypothetical protein